MLKVEWDKEKNVITVGKAVFDQYLQYGKSSQSWTNKVLKENGIENISVYNKREQNQKVNDILGCSRVRLFQHFNSLQLKVFVSPHYDILKKLADFRWFNKRQFNDRLIYKVNKSAALLRQAYNDGLYNLLPIIAQTGKSPQELKKELKGAWKIVANNSLRKNKALVLNGRSITSISVSLPTTLLHYSKWLADDAALYLKYNFKGSWNNEKKMVDEARVFWDSKIMANQLGKTVDPKWTPRRLKEEHDKMAHEINSKRYPKERFTVVDYFKTKRMMHPMQPTLVATMLESPYEMADEGTCMGHCVASYSGSVASGHYLAYSVTRDGVRSSTVGISVNLTKGIPTFVSMNQHYGKYNAKVEDRYEIELGHMLVKQLNQEIDERETQ